MNRDQASARQPAGARRSDQVAARAADDQPLQDRYAPGNICFGCGPANPEGLQIKSHVEGDEVVARWTPEPKYQAFTGFLNGGIIGTLLDCHSNWAATYHLMQQSGSSTPPCTVTAEYSVKMMRPTPSTTTLTLRSRPVKVSANSAVIESTIEADGEVCATFRGVFVAVKPGHPAYHRW